MTVFLNDVERLLKQLIAQGLERIETPVGDAEVFVEPREAGIQIDRFAKFLLAAVEQPVDPASRFAGWAEWRFGR